MYVWHRWPLFFRGRLALVYELTGALPIAQFPAMNPNGKPGAPTPKENSAARLLRLCERARTTHVQSLGNHSSAMDGWAVTFGLATAPPSPPSNARDVEVVRLLGVAQVELDRMRDELSELGVEVPPSANDKLNGLLSARNLSVNWSDTTNQFAADAATALQIFAQMLPADEQPVAPDELAAIMKEVAGLRLTIRESDLPRSFAAFLLRQLATIERALRDYPITGAASFRDASDSLVGGWIHHRDELREHAERKEVKEVISLGDRVTTIAKRVVLLHQVTKALLGIGHAAADVALTVQHLLPGSGPQ